MGKIFLGAEKLAAESIIAIIKIYQILISPEKSFWGRGRNIKICRFYPTCSDYAIESLREKGLFKGCFFAIKRILRCHPWNPGGYDPVQIDNNKQK